MCFWCVSMVRKMCVCITKPTQGPVFTNAYLGKGNPLRVPRCIPSGCPVPSITLVADPREIRGVFGSWFRALRASQAPEATCGRCIARQESLRAPPTPPRPNWAQSPPLWTPSTNRAPFGCRHAVARGHDQRGFRPLVYAPNSLSMSGYETYMFLLGIYYVTHMFHP